MLLIDLPEYFTTPQAKTYINSVNDFLTQRVVKEDKDLVFLLTFQRDMAIKFIEEETGKEQKQVSEKKDLEGRTKNLFGGK